MNMWRRAGLKTCGHNIWCHFGWRDETDAVRSVLLVTASTTMGSSVASSALRLKNVGCLQPEHDDDCRSDDTSTTGKRIRQVRLSRASKAPPARRIATPPVPRRTANFPDHSGCVRHVRVSAGLNHVTNLVTNEEHGRHGTGTIQQPQWDEKRSPTRSHGGEVDEAGVSSQCGWEAVSLWLMQ